VAKQHLHPDQCAISAAGPVSAREIARVAKGLALQSTH
jgi:hypothetical protein